MYEVMYDSVNHSNFHINQTINMCRTFVVCNPGIRWLKWVLFLAIPYYQLLANTKTLESRRHPWLPRETGSQTQKLWSRDGTPWLPRETGSQIQNFWVKMAPLGYQGRLGRKQKALESRWHPFGYQGRLGCKRKTLESRWHPLVTKGDWVA